MSKTNLPALGLTILFLLTFAADPAKGQPTSTAERIAFAAYRHGQWDIYSLAPDGSTPRQLTNDVFEDADPAYSPQGDKLAFASRRNNNWDVYVLDLPTGQETRLTNSPHYEGAPTWSPDGQSLAYESYQAGNLDIWRVDAAGIGPAINLTANSPAGDFAPAWSPAGRTLAFTSWREGNKDLFLLEIASGNVTRLTDTPTAEEWPVWHPNGKQLAFVIDDLGDREVFVLDTAQPPTQNGPMEPVTWLGRTDGPAWSPTGDTLAAIFHRWDGEVVALQTSGAIHQLPHLLTGIISIQGRLTWHQQAVEAGQRVATLSDNGGSPLYREQLTANEAHEAEPFNLVRLDDLEVGTPWLADTVDDSFQAWRFRLRDEVGYDFLGVLSDATRDVAAYSETSQYASWHKSGRAIDTLFDYHLNGELAHEIGREDYSGETYWRIFLRCADQSGRCGRPVTANPWNYSSRARTQIAPEQGGLEKANLAGYYVDMTALAREYGWQRISSHDDEEYSWTWHFLAFEYWHYQKRLADDQAETNSSAANWYQAMLDVYPPNTLERFFTWPKMRALGEDSHLIALKGVPLPLEAKPWWALVEQP
ncbi:MAG: PD40 domain-containing protein [Anaerolineae bacterium]|nr:PD40 domain-containing protein [Anaerolineae bacterium]